MQLRTIAKSSFAFGRVGWFPLILTLAPWGRGLG